jgi:hypothetical protein
MGCGSEVRVCSSDQLGLRVSGVAGIPERWTLPGKVAGRMNDTLKIKCPSIRKLLHVLLDEDSDSSGG